MSEKSGRTLVWLLPVVCLTIGLIVIWLQDQRVSHFKKRIEETKLQIETQIQVNRKLGLPDLG
jgi:cytochrome c-type biogenesis protein CcmH/NrfF